MVMDSSALLSKYMSEKDGDSLKFMQRMIYLIFAEVVYQRELLPREHFTEKNILGCALHVPNVNKDRRQMMLHTNLKGAAAAVTDKKLKQYHLMVHNDRNDPTAASEVFIMDVVYADDDETSMQMSSPELSEVRVRYSGAEELQKQTKHVFRCLRKGLSTLEPITRNVSFSFYITYRDGVDRSFHPAGYGQAARMYDIPETAEIGDMGMLHAKEHACLLKVKSTMLEDGFQLMQTNAATQPTQSSGSLSTETQEGMSESGTSDQASSLGVFQSHSEWEETPQKKKGEERKRDQRSLGQKSAASARTIRFGDEEEVSNRLNESFISEMGSVLLAAAAADPVDRTPPAAPAAPAKTPVENADWEMEDTTPTQTSGFASSDVTMVTRKLMAADKKRKEDDEKKRKEEEEERAKEKAPPAKQQPPQTTKSSDRSHSSIDGGSEGSEEPPVTRRVSLRKRTSLPKVKEESTESDEPSNDGREKMEIALPEDIISSGKEADTEPSEDTVEKKTASSAKKGVVLERRRSARLRESMEESSTTVPSDEGEKTRNEATIQPPEKKSGGKKDRKSDSSYQSSGETMGTNPSESRRASRGAEAMDTNETPKRAPRVVKMEAAKTEEMDEPEEMRTPGEAPKKARYQPEQ